MRFHGLSHHAATLCIVAALAAQPAAAKVISVSATTPDANVLPIYDTTRIHVAAGVDWILGEG